MHKFLSCNEGTSHLVKVIYNATWKALLSHCKDLEKPRFPLPGLTGISPVNIGWITIYSGLGTKPGLELFGLNDKSKSTLRNRLSEVKFLVIHELCMV